MKLAPDQMQAAKACYEWLQGDDLVAGLFASAGYGKSYCIAYIINEVILKHTNWTPVLTSMTHSAVKVLQDFSDLPVSTLHSLMKWVPAVNKDTGDEYLKTHKDKQLTSGQLVIVDEAGLLGEEELKLLLREAYEVGAKVLFMGDHKQLYPVSKSNQYSIPAYDACKVRFELTTPKRQDKDDIVFKLAQRLRSSVDGEKLPVLKGSFVKDGKGIIKSEDIVEDAVAAFKEALTSNEEHLVKVLAFRNDRCLSLNTKIRRGVLGHKSLIPEVGEVMMANTSIVDPVQDEVIIRNNQFLTVYEVEPTTQNGLSGAFITYRSQEDNELIQPVFVPESPGKLRNRLNQISREAKLLAAKDPKEASKKWRAFYALKDRCADIRFTYAMTVNKAQGITLKHVLVDADDMMACSHKGQRARMLYTAATRATHKVTIEGL